MNTLQHRFFDPSSLERLFNEKEVSRHRVIESPLCDITIDPLHEEIALTVPAVGPEPDLGPYGRISFSVLGDSRDKEYEIRIDASNAHFEAYNILTAIIEELFAGSSLIHATTEALANYKELLRGGGGLTNEQQKGLYGELIVLRKLIRAVGEIEAIGCWLGPQSEQHDFAFADYDAECKTTLSEKRIHTISSSSQLEKTPGRDLWLISVQITRAGSQSGESLSELINSIVGSLHTQRIRFLRHLTDQGWRSVDAASYSQKYMLRSRIENYFVGDDFPAITNQRLLGIIPSFELLSGISYRVDVSARTPGRAPMPLDVSTAS